MMERNDVERIYEKLESSENWKRKDSGFCVVESGLRFDLYLTHLAGEIYNMAEGGMLVDNNEGGELIYDLPVRKNTQQVTLEV